MPAEGMRRRDGVSFSGKEICSEIQGNENEASLLSEINSCLIGTSKLTVKALSGVVLCGRQLERSVRFLG